MGIAEKLSVLIKNQSEVARMTGVAQSAISEASSGKRRLYVDQAFRIARVLGVPLDYLADDAQQGPPPPAEVSPDERSILQVCRALRLDGQEAVRRLIGEGGTARTIGRRDETKADQRNHPDSEIEPEGDDEKPQPPRRPRRPRR